VVAPTAKTVVGTLPKAGPVAAGNADNGKKLYTANGCGGCHTFKPAGSSGKVGPSLDNLAADAKKANQGALDQYAFTSIKNPDAYIVPGFTPGVMPNFGGTLKDAQISDLVAFLTKTS
jgi:cytochrome c2